jgi:hypothetical protein
MPPKAFSLKEVIITALVTLIVSGGGGALLNEYFSRAKPAASIISVGFEGLDRSIELPSTLLETARKSHWVSLERYMPFNLLLKKDTEIAENIENFKSGLDITTAWLDKMPLKSGSETPLSVDELDDCPFTKNSMISNVLLSDYQMRKYDSPPHTIAQLKKNAVVAPINHENGNLIVNLGPGQIRLPFNSPDSETNAAVELLAFSFSRGDRENIIHYHRVFSDNAGRHIRALEQLQASLREILLRRAKLKLSVFYSNTGRDSVVMRPYLGLVIDNPDFKGKPFILSTVSVGSSERTSSATNTKTQPLLPESSPMPYFSLSPNQSNTLRFISLDPLGDDAAKLVGIYSTGVLRCKVVAFTASKKVVESPTSVFGAQISQGDRQEINESVSRKAQ